MDINKDPDCATCNQWDISTMKSFYTCHICLVRASRDKCEHRTLLIDNRSICLKCLGWPVEVRIIP